MTAKPEVVVPTGKTEAFTLTCETPEGEIISTREVTVARGERLEVQTGCEKKPKKPKRRR